MNSRQIALDSAMTAALVVALVTVYLIDRRSPTSDSAQSLPPQITVQEETETGSFRQIPLELLLICREESGDVPFDRHDQCFIQCVKRIVREHRRSRM